MSIDAPPWTGPAAVPAIRDALRSLIGGDLDSVWQAPDREVTDGLAAIGQARLLLEAAEVALVREGMVRGLPSESAWGPHDWVRVAEGSHAPTPATGHVAAVVRTARAGIDQSGPMLTGAPDPEAPVSDLAGVTAALAEGNLPLGKADQLVRFHERVVRVADPTELGEALATLVEGARDDVIETGPGGRRRERVRGLTERELAAAIRMTERLLRPEKLQEEDDEQGKRGRSLTKGPGPCGLAQYTLILEPEGAAVVDSAIAALSGPVKGSDGEPDPRPAARRRADALIEIIRRGVSAPGETPTCDKAQVVVTIGLEALLGDEHARSDVADRRGGRTRTHRAAGGPAGGMSRGLAGGLVSSSGLTLTGEVLPPSVVRRLACDGGIIPAVLGSRGEILDLGRSVRWFTPGQKKALWLRDRGCTFPGCTMPPQWTDAHHVDWWSRGGGTDVSNGALLCERHHTHVHTHGLTATIDATGVTWHR